MNTRIYVVNNRKTNEERLVRAANPAAAIRHVARSLFGVEVAAQETIVNLVQDGAKVEDAGTGISD